MFALAKLTVQLSMSLLSHPLPLVEPLPRAPRAWTTHVVCTHASLAYSLRSPPFALCSALAYSLRSPSFVLSRVPISPPNGRSQLSLCLSSFPNAGSLSLPFCTSHLSVSIPILDHAVCVAGPHVHGSSTSLASHFLTPHPLSGDTGPT